MANKSAGILPFRIIEGNFEVFIVHPGGPFWKNKDLGAWSIVKGEFQENETALDAAYREFKEETGFEIAPDATTMALSSVTQKSGKTVYAWACEMDLDPKKMRSNTFEIEWPPGSGRRQQFTEIDMAEWFPPDSAKKKINPAQKALVDELCSRLQEQGRI